MQDHLGMSEDEWLKAIASMQREGYLDEPSLNVATDTETETDTAG